VYYGLDSVGTRVWQLLQQDKTLADVCLVMVDEYDAPADVLQNDISTLVHELCEKHLLMPRQPPEA
jgi:hypothetical protein